MASVTEKAPHRSVYMRTHKNQDKNMLSLLVLVKALVISFSANIMIYSVSVKNFYKLSLISFPFYPHQPLTLLTELCIN